MRMIRQVGQVDQVSVQILLVSHAFAVLAKRLVLLDGLNDGAVFVKNFLDVGRIRWPRCHAGATSAVHRPMLSAPGRWPLKGLLLLLR